MGGRRSLKNRKSGLRKDTQRTFASVLDGEKKKKAITKIGGDWGIKFLDLMD